MGKYIKVFETNADYQQFMGGGEVPLPNVSYVRETNACNYTPKPTLSPIINFTIIGNAYQAERGMTWDEWCGSKYNTIDAYCENNYVFWTNTSNTELYTLVIYGNGTIYIKPSDIIISDGEYAKRTNPL